MQLSEALPSDPKEEELALTLYRAARFLRGKNLRKSTWSDIAAFFQGQGNLQVKMWKRLMGAETRDDVLRVLRIIRKHSRKKNASSGGGARRWKTAAIQHHLETAWKSGIEPDECWNTTDPNCRCGEYECECKRRISIVAQQHLPTPNFYSN